MDAKRESLQSACTTIKYKVDSQMNEVLITLKPYLPNLYYRYSSLSHNVSTIDITDDLFQQLNISLNITPCPWGFEEQDNGSCQCEHRLSLLGFHCDSDNYKFHRSAMQWIGATSEHNYGKKVPGVIFHQHCPFDYCRTDNDSLSISLQKSGHAMCI